MNSINNASLMLISLILLVGCSTKKEGPAVPEQRQAPSDASASQPEAKITKVDYIVPDNIVSLPANFTGYSLVDYLDELEKLPFDNKGQFEKTVDFNKRMKAIWPNATLFNQPAQSRQIVVVAAKPSYDADTERLTVNLQLPNGSRTIGSTGAFFHYIVSLANIELTTGEIHMNLPPELAKNLFDQLKVAYVFRFGLHPKSDDFSPITQSYENLEHDTAAYKIMVRSYGIGDHTNVMCELWVDELSEVLCFRHDTGEILKRINTKELKAKENAIQQALASGDYAAALQLDPNNAEALQNKKAAENDPLGALPTGRSPTDTQPVTETTANADKWLANLEMLIKSAKWDEMKPAAEKASALPMNDEQKVRAEALYEVADLASYYQGGIKKAVSDIAVGNDFEVTKDFRVIVVGKSDDSITIQFNARKKTYKFDELPFSLAHKLASFTIPASPTLVAAKSIYQSISPKATEDSRKEALEWLNSLDSDVEGIDPKRISSTLHKMYNGDNAAALELDPKNAAALAGNDLWASLISPQSLEDEVKRIKLEYDGVVTTPGAFNSGGYLDARLHLTVLASLFAVINQHPGEVRWKDQAAAARDLISRTAFNCKAGSTQVYNEAKLRKGDLQDLVAGHGLAGKDAEEETDWVMIADRSPLMEYGELLIDALENGARDEGTINQEADLVKRNSELLALLGEILAQEGMDDADDDDYAKLSRDMAEEGKAVTAALGRGDFDAVRLGVSKIRQKCDACHEQYR